MLQRIGKENKINFLSIDYDKLAKDVHDMKESREKKPENKPLISKQTSGNMYAHKVHTVMNFLNEDNTSTLDKKAEEIVESNLPKKLDNDFSRNPHLTNKSVFSTRGGVITDIGGPSRQIKTDISNSIWDSNKLQSMIEKKSDQEFKPKETIEEQRKAIEKQRMDDLVENLKMTDQRKASGITQIGLHSGSNYRTPNNAMSIFDTEDFVRLAEKTEGEKLSENIKAEKETDKSWRSGKQIRSTKDVVNDLFDKLSNE